MIITISREFGCGGRLIGRKLAAELGLLYYDSNLIQMAADKSGLSPEFIESSESLATNSFLFNLSATASFAEFPYQQYDVPLSQKVYLAQTAVIQEIAETGGCLIVGRCAEYILRERKDCIKVFLHGNKKDRLERAIREYDIDPVGAEGTLDKMDKGRMNYHKFHTALPWGDVHQYDITLNTSVSGMDGAVAAIKALAKSI